MELFSIVTTTPVEDLETRLHESITKIDDCALTLRLTRHHHTSNTVLTLGVDFSRRNALVLRELRFVCRQLIAEALERHIVDVWQGGELRRIIDTDFSYFEPHERQVILGFAEGKANADLNSRLRERILQYLEQNRTVNVQGFVKFRLQDHRASLREAVSRAVDQYLSEKEYDEFIGLLRYFVDIQNTKIPLVHIHGNEDGFCKLVDENGRCIHHDYLESIGDPSADSVDYDDLLISALITLAPERVVLHASVLSSRPETMETVKSVFRDRVVRCEHCDSCKSRNIMPVYD